MKNKINKTWGYNIPEVYYGRFSMITEFINNNIPQETFTIIDWGSDSGWTSVALSNYYSDSSNVISIDSGIMYNNTSCIDDHLRAIGEYKIKNNTVLKMTFTEQTWQDIHPCPVNIQLLLSIFHWTGTGRNLSVSQWDTAFSTIIKAAEYTFIEIPNRENPNESPHEIRNWYNDRDEYDVLKQALDANDIKNKIYYLGSTTHGKKGPRKTFVVHNLALGNTIDNNVADIVKTKYQEFIM